MRKVSNKRFFALLISFLLLFWFFLTPTSYYIEEPGQAIPIEPIIDIEGQAADTDGTFRFTTVSFSPASPSDLVVEKIKPYHDIIDAEEMYGGLENPDVYNEMQKLFMESSKQTAVEAAYKASGHPVERAYHGVYVVNVIEASDFYNDLKPGDIITELNGQPFANTQEFMETVKSHQMDEVIDLTYIRDGREQQTSGQLIYLEETQSIGIGISLTDHSEIKMEPEISIDTGSIGGPSAGFMFALQIYSLLENPDLPQGQDIAGTGTIEATGDVGRISGIDKKIVAAHKSGCDIFFAPNDTVTAEMLEVNPKMQTNYEEARQTAEDIGTDMKIIPVDHVQDAIDYLNNAAQSEEESGEDFSFFNETMFFPRI